MTPADIARLAVGELAAAERALQTGTAEYAHAHAVVSIAASLALIARPPARASTYGEYDRDATVQDRQEVWANDPDELRRRELRDARD